MNPRQDRRTKSLSRPAALAMLAAAACMSEPTLAAPSLDADCHALKLNAASGVPGGTKHEYKFLGTCNINIVFSSGPSVLQTVPAEAKGLWDGGSLSFQESFHILAPVQIPAKTFHSADGQTNLPELKISAGAVDSIFKCNDDPLITGASCITTSHANNSSFEPFSNPAENQHRPLLKGKTTLAEATKLSNQNAGGPPATPPPPAPNHMPSAPQKETPIARATGGPAATVAASANPVLAHVGPIKLVLEGEDFVKSGKLQVAGGKTAVQPMARFGAGWSGNAQLFWSGGAVGAVLDLMVDIPEPGKYAVELYMTRAPDYANLKLEVDGKASPVPISLFAPSVMTTGPMQAGAFSLQAGQRKISFMIVGKYERSKDFFVGLDRVVLSKIGPP